MHFSLYIFALLSVSSGILAHPVSVSDTLDRRADATPICSWIAKPKSGCNVATCYGVPRTPTETTSANESSKVEETLVKENGNATKSPGRKPNLKLDLLAANPVFSKDPVFPMATCASSLAAALHRDADFFIKGFVAPLGLGRRRRDQDSTAQQRQGEGTDAADWARERVETGSGGQAHPSPTRADQRGSLIVQRVLRLLLTLIPLTDPSFSSYYSSYSSNRISSDYPIHKNVQL
ncbi:hypothetical protein C8J56DRAFT_1056565 [Mycena floridula]|nr:hypothetical protein C8J56DRAFT_1056565 [Mycena floridula]